MTENIPNIPDIPSPTEQIGDQTPLYFFDKSGTPQVPEHSTDTSSQISAPSGLGQLPPHLTQGTNDSPTEESKRPTYVLDNLPPHLRANLVAGKLILPVLKKDILVPFKPKKIRKIRPINVPEPEPAVEGGLAFPFPYVCLEWLGKTPKSHVMEYFQRMNLPGPKFVRESHPSRQLHLIKVTFNDQSGKELTIWGDRYFSSAKDSEHNTAILVLCHLLPGVKSAQEIIDRMTKMKVESQRKKKINNKPLRMQQFAGNWKNKPYSRVPGPHQAFQKNHTNKAMYDYSYDPTQGMYDMATLQNYWNPNYNSMMGQTVQPTYDYASYGQHSQVDYSNAMASAGYTYSDPSKTTHQSQSNRTYVAPQQAARQVPPYPPRTVGSTASTAAWSGYGNTSASSTQHQRGYVSQANSGAMGTNPYSHAQAGQTNAYTNPQQQRFSHYYQ